MLRKSRQIANSREVLPDIRIKRFEAIFYALLHGHCLTRRKRQQMRKFVEDAAKSGGSVDQNETVTLAAIGEQADGANASEGMRHYASTAQLMTLLMFPCTVSILLALQQCADYSIDLKQISMCSVGHAVGREIKSHYVESLIQ